MGILLATMQVMKKTVTSGNGATRRGKIVKKRVANFEKGTGLVSAVGIFLIWVCVDSLVPISLVVSIIQNMVMIIGDEGVIGEGVLRVVGDNIVKRGGHFKGKSKQALPA